MNEEEKGNLSKQARMDFSHSTTRSYTAKTGIFPREVEEGRQHTPFWFEWSCQTHEQFLEKSPTSNFTS